MTYVISDIHAEYDLFLTLLDRIHFSDEDVMYVCGDIIEKGKDSARLLQYVRSKKNIHCIIGNHEYDFLKYYWSLTSANPDDFEEVLKKLQQRLQPDGYLLDWDAIDWLESLPYYIETEKFICVHAGLPLDGDMRVLPLSQASREQLVYDRNFKEPSVVPKTDKCIFFGHTPTSYLCNEARILAYERDTVGKDGAEKYCKVHLDLGVWLHGVMGCFCVENGKGYYVQK